MPSYQDIVLGPEALAYVLDCLHAGGALSRELLKCNDVLAGTVRTRLPVDSDTTELDRLEQGGKLRASRKEGVFWGFGEPRRMMPVPDTLDELAQELHDSLRSQGGSCLIENELARAGDPVLATGMSRILTCDSSVFHLLCSRDDSTIIRASVREARSATFFVGVMSGHSSSHCEDLAGSAISYGEIAALAAEARAVFVPAYDGEAYVVWTPGVKR